VSCNVAVLQQLKRYASDFLRTAENTFVRYECQMNYTAEIDAVPESNQINQSINLFSSRQQDP